MPLETPQFIGSSDRFRNLFPVGGMEEAGDRPRENARFPLF
jgi:hypothetical protein